MLDIDRLSKGLPPVPHTPPTMSEEIAAAVVGCGRLLIGRRDVQTYFAQDTRGLVTSFIALVCSVGLTLLLSELLTSGPQEGSSFALLVQNAILFAGITGASWVTLKLAGKPDRFVPYLVADNWINAVLAVVLAVIAVIARSPEAVLVVAAVAGLVARVNNARLIVGLSIGHIVMLIVVQTIGLMIALLVVGIVFGGAAA